MPTSISHVISKIDSLFQDRKQKSTQLARQLLFSVSKTSKVVENYFYNNEGMPQKLDKFPQHKQIYDFSVKELVLKCSRKVLKSTAISNFLVKNALANNFYKQCYCAPSEKQAKEFSSDFLDARLNSPAIAAIIGKLSQDDVFHKKVDNTQSTIAIKYFSEDATRMRGPSYHEMYFDEVQNMSLDEIPIALDCMRMLPTKKRTFSGTPLTDDGTIDTIFNRSCGFEWVIKCESCNHHNMMTKDNDPMKMIGKEGLCCSKCGSLLNPFKGEWVAARPEKRDAIGYHMACPIIPFYNDRGEQWKAIYDDVFNKGNSIVRIYNEIFGLAYDIGAKPITEAELRKACSLGRMYDEEGGLKIFKENKGRYVSIWAGVDFGVNMTTSRTVLVVGGLREDLIFEVFLVKVFKGLDYKEHNKEIAHIIDKVNAKFSGDSGPDPARCIDIIELLGPNGPKRGQLVRYENGKKVQRFDAPRGTDWRAWRWVLHRSDTLTFTLKSIKDGRILFPAWEDCSEGLRDILNVFIEVKELALRQEIYYRHKPDEPDDALHAINWALCLALSSVNHPILSGQSSTSDDELAD